MKQKLLKNFCDYMEIPLPESRAGNKYRWVDSVPFFSELEIVFNSHGFVDALGVPQDDLYFIPLFRYAQKRFTDKAGEWREDVRLHYWEERNEDISSIPFGIQ